MSGASGMSNRRIMKPMSPMTSSIPRSNTLFEVA